MDDRKESSNESNKDELIEVTIDDSLDTETMDASSSESSEKEATVVKLGKEEMHDEPTNEATDVTSREPLGSETMEVSESSVKNRSCPSDQHGKDETVQSSVKSKIKDSKLQPTKRPFKEISSSESAATESPDSDENAQSVKKLILDIADATVESTNISPVSSENLPADSLDNKSLSSELQSLDITEPSSSSEPSKDETSPPETATKSPANSDDDKNDPFLAEENSRALFATGGRYYSTKTERAYSQYIKITQTHAEIRDPRGFYLNTYKKYFGLKYFSYPLFHILAKDLLDMLDFFNGNDGFRIPENVGSEDVVFTPEEWKAQFVRPYFHIGPQQMEASTLSQLEVQFDNSVLETLFNPESNYQLDDTFFKSKMFEDKFNLEYEFQSFVRGDDLQYVVESISFFSYKSEEYFFTSCNCVMSLLEHINSSRNRSVEIDAARLTMDILWMLRKMGKMRKTLVRLLKLEGKKNFSLGTGYILKVKFHAVVYFNALLIKYTKRIKKFGSNVKGLLKLLEVV